MSGGSTERADVQTLAQRILSSTANAPGDRDAAVLADAYLSLAAALRTAEEALRDESAAAQFLLTEYVEPFGERGIHMADARQVVTCLRGIVAARAALRSAATGKETE